MFLAVFTSRSCTVPHSLQVHAHIRKPALPFGLLVRIPATATVLAETSCTHFVVRQPVAVPQAESLPGKDQLAGLVVLHKARVLKGIQPRLYLLDCGLETRQHSLLSLNCLRALAKFSQTCCTVRELSSPMSAMTLTANWWSSMASTTMFIC